ncbi:MAG: F0F1 ATP synthase subunit delta [Desulfofustis sp. PB-SRB1]|nr:F0F1 ATP synthase subunit delta [Desulfofustis sp. PB-SRB1]MBM1001328.1 F0F1 ATP synthase subunit delta [Desulfofustis sp. PB-SRB1]HBH28939.1 F0F1 ATP synthase subunit delta [Desulfofustis sp.]HBH32137.1 F0F1 ATP synthase subunit delta [Desulfofustis sp.]
MKQTILAKRYAKALFAVGAENNQEEAYNAALRQLADFCADNPEVMDALTNPLYPVDAREKVMAGIIGAMDADPVLGNFLNLLVEKKRAAIIPEIAEQFQVMVDTANNISHGTVTSAIELSDPLLDKVRMTMEKLTGTKVELTASVDPSIVGGIVAKVGDLVLDGSIKTQLARLKDSIKGRE